jgi:hypothetical protein
MRGEKATFVATLFDFVTQEWTDKTQPDWSRAE